MNKSYKIFLGLSFILMLFVTWVYIGTLFNWTLSGKEGTVNFVYVIYYIPISLLVGSTIHIYFFIRKKITKINYVLPILGIFFTPIFFWFFQDPSYEVVHVVPSDFIMGIKVIAEYILNEIKTIK
jgi:hypothetical protein